jgi:cytochrome d ubiquinol oxidase subunit II
MNSIGPLWDGNEVWLITFGGALFAAFPEAYATVFSGFYTAFYLLLFALILRAVSMEFRSKLHHSGWRGFWDYAFFTGSFLAALLFGVAVGNVVRGLPLNEQGDFTGTILNQLNPYSLLVGVFVVVLLAMHGSIYLFLKTEGTLQEKIKPWMWRTFGVFMVLYMLTTIFTLVAMPHAIDNLRAYPWLWVVPVLNVLAIANIPRAIYLNRPGYAFLSSCATIGALVALLGAALYPNLVTASNDPALSLTLMPGSAPSSQKTLSIMLLIAIIGIPFVLSYTAVIYWTFRGKVEIGEHSY